MDELERQLKNAHACATRLHIRAELANTQNARRNAVHKGVTRGANFVYESVIEIAAEMFREDILAIGAGVVLLQHLSSVVLFPALVAVMFGSKILRSR